MTSAAGFGRPAASEPDDLYVSTGALPQATRVGEVVAEAYERFRDDRSGEVSTVYPILSTADPDRFGICVSGVDGSLYEAGDSRSGFPIMSVAKPFVFALVCQAVGIDPVRQLVGINATGRPFDSIAAIEQDPHGRTNPMVNPGAIATTSLAPGESTGARWAFLADGLSRFAGRTLPIAAEVFLWSGKLNASGARRMRPMTRRHGDEEGASKPGSTHSAHVRPRCTLPRSRRHATWRP